MDKADHEGIRYIQTHSKQLLHVLFWVFVFCGVSVVFYFGIMPSKINRTNCPMKLITAFTKRSLSKIHPLIHTLSSLHGKIFHLILQPMIFVSSLGQLVSFCIMRPMKCSIYYISFLYFLQVSLKIRTKCISHSYFYSHFSLPDVSPLFSFHLLCKF